VTVLTDADRRMLAAARTATLATIDPSGRPRLVPCCFVVDGDTVWTPIDDKPKTTDDARSLARVRDILARPAVSLLVDRWSEDWTQLGWVRLNGLAGFVESGRVPAEVVAELRTKYPQYRTHDLGARPAIRVTVEDVSRWSATSTV
jgi:PPOX class probable F420-dependent enzyme